MADWMKARWMAGKQGRNALNYASCGVVGSCGHGDTRNCKSCIMRGLMGVVVIAVVDVCSAGSFLFGMLKSSESCEWQWG